WVKLAQVVAEGPAEKAGLKAGDVIQAVDKEDVKNLQQFFEQLRMRNPGDKVKLKVLRDKESKTVELTLEPRQAARGANRPWGFSYGGQQPNVHNLQGSDSFQYGGVYKSTDAGETWTRINSIDPRPMYFSQVRVDPSDDKYLYVCGISMYRSKN